LPSLYSSESLEPLHDGWVGIVDDDESVRRALARYLRICGIRVETFGSAAEFLSYGGTAPSCLVIDVQLGTSTGFELRDCLFDRDAPPPPMIFITACDDIAAFDPGHGRGISAWLRKPLRAEALVDLVYQLSAADRSADLLDSTSVNKKEA
jgi:FixJ family two-component response regulator